MLNKILDKVVLAIFDRIPFLSNNKRTVGNVLTILSGVLYVVQNVYPIMQIGEVINWLNILLVGLGVKAVGDQHAAAKVRRGDEPIVA